MKSILSFIRTTLTGGVLFLLPVILLIILIKKAFELIAPLAAPLVVFMPVNFLGFDGSRLAAILMLVILCFIGGLLFRSKRVQKWVVSLEDNVLSAVPGYFLLKNVAADVVGNPDEHNMKPILYQEEDTYSIGFLVEEMDGWSTVWLPETPKQDSGNAIIVPSEKVIHLNTNTFHLRRSLKVYGKGVIQQAAISRQ
ncbi:MAG: hypothetical protein IT270_01445 [Saprospiraceae bacterium]|nr:hypothetical protein [Saprospiraceae bacterium]